jgi:hypothetical protein
MGDVTLDGLNVVRASSFTELVSKGNWREAYYVDERATPPQRDALTAIFSTAPGGVWAKQAGLIGEALGVKFVPITFEADGKHRKLSVGGIADADITAIAGMDDKEVTIDHLSWWPFPLVAAKASHATYKDHGLQLDNGRGGGILALRIQLRLSRFVLIRWRSDASCRPEACLRSLSGRDGRIWSPWIGACAT